MASVGGLGRRAVVIGAFASASLVAAAALGDDPRARARVSYEAGAAAAAQHDYAEAARRFAEADDFAPNDVTLSEALKAATRADDPVLAMRLADRADARHASGAVPSLAAAARAKFADRAGQVTLLCPDERRCDATLDGAPVAIGAAIWTTPGKHAVTLSTAPNPQTVEVAAGSTATFRPTAPTPAPAQAPAPARAQAQAQAPAQAQARAQAPAQARAQARAQAQAPPVDSDRRPSPVWFGLAVAGTAGLTVVSAWSGADALSLHDQWNNGDDAAKSKGQDAQLRTNVLLGVTAAAAIGTVVLAVVTFGNHAKPAAARARPGLFSGTF